MKIGVGRIEAEFSEDVDQSADADVPEEIFCSLRATLSGFVDLRGRERFREGQLGIFHHTSAYEGNEQYSQNASDHDQCGGLPVSVGEAKRRPGLRQKKC